jgi:hypothetical protein
MPSAETLFFLVNLAVVPGWLLLVVAPRWRYSARLVAGVLLPGLLALSYLVLISVSWGDTEGGFSSVTEVQKLFADPYLLVVGWMHYLAFDLFIGSWEMRDAQRLGLSHLLVMPCLVLTFLLGPVGLLAYLVVRGIRTRRVLLDECAS